MDIINLILDWLQAQAGWGYMIAGLVSLAESLAFVGLLIPGGNFTIAVGILTAYGVYGFWTMVGIVSLGAMLGDIISFWLGKKSQVFFAPDNRWLRSNYLDRGKMFFKRHGRKSVFTGRFIGPIRPIIPFVAGIFNMDFNKFNLYNITSAILWSMLYVGIGYGGGYYWKNLESLPAKITLFLIPIAIVVMAWFLFLGADHFGGNGESDEKKSQNDEPHREL